MFKIKINKSLILVSAVSRPRRVSLGLMLCSVFVLLFLSLLFLPTQSTQAATRTWSGAVSNLWNTAGNWDTLPSAGDDLVFPSSASNKSNNNDFAADTSFNSITIQGTGYTLAGNQITLGAGGITQTTGTNTISLAIVLGANVTVGVEGTSLTLSGVISDGGGGYSVSKTGAKKLIMDAVNTFTGGMIAKAGQIEPVYGGTKSNVYGADANIISIGDTVGTENASVAMWSNSIDFKNPVRVVAGSSGTKTIIMTFSSRLSGTITLAADLTLQGAFVVRGGINGTGNVILYNDTVYVTELSGGTSFTGNLEVRTSSSGTLNISTTNLNHTGTITNSGTGSGTTTISAVIGTNVTGVIQNSATSQLTLSGANTFTSGLTIKAGAVRGQTSNNCFGADSNVITLGDTSGTADTTIVNGGSITLANPITVAAGSSGVHSIVATTNGGITLNGAITLANNLLLTSPTNNYSLVINGGITGTGNITLNNTNTGGAGLITVSNNSVNHTGTITNSGTGTGTTTISAVIGSNVTGLTQNSTTSKLIISGNNSTISGDVNITSGTLELSGTTNLNVAGNWTNSDTFTKNSSTVTFTKATDTQTINPGASSFNNLTHSGLGTLQLTGNALTVSGILNNSAGTIDINTNNLTVSTTLTNNGLITASTGQITIPNATSGNFTFTDTNTIPQATYTDLTINASGKALTLSNNTTAQNLTITAGALAVAGNNLTVSTTLSNSGTITTTGNGSNIIISSSDLGNVNFANNATSLPAKNYSTLILQNGGTATGTTIAQNLTLTVGTLAVGSNSLTISNTLTNNGLITASTGQITIPNASSGNFTFTDTNTIPQATYSTLTLSGTDKTFTQAGSITADTINLSGVSTIATGSNTLAVSTTLTNSGTITTTGNGSNIIITSSDLGNVNFANNATSLPAKTYSTLILQNGGTITGNTTAQNLTITSGILSTNTNNLTVSTTLTNNGLITAGTGQITIPNASSGAFTFTDTNTIPQATYTDLTINASGKTLTLSNNTIAQNLTITSGTLDHTTNHYTLLVDGTFTNNGTILNRPDSYTSECNQTTIDVFPITQTLTGNKAYYIYRQDNPQELNSGYIQSTQWQDTDPHDGAIYTIKYRNQDLTETTLASITAPATTCGSRNPTTISSIVNPIVVPQPEQTQDQTQEPEQPQSNPPTQPTPQLTREQLISELKAKLAELIAQLIVLLQERINNK